MNEPIIIKTPQPDAEERLVLVPPSAVTEYESEAGPRLDLKGCCARDATPADLERGGYVTGEMLAEHVRIVWAAGQKAEPVGVAMLRKLKERAEKAEAAARGAEERAARAEAEAAMTLAPGELVISAPAFRELKLRAEGRESHGEPGTLAHLRNDLRDATKRAEEAEVLAEQAEARAGQVSFHYRNAIGRAEKAEADAKELAEELAERCETLRVERNAAQDRTERAERELVGLRDQMEQERERADQAERELARLTAPAEGEPSGAELLAMFERTPDLNDLRMRAVWRAGVAHERARQAATVTSTPVSSSRATDEELDAAFVDAATPTADENARLCQNRHARQLRGVRAVAARVRQEPGLVERLVADPWLDSVSVDAVMGGAIRVRVVRRVDSLANTLGTPKEAYCSRAEVPATLARLVEVPRG